MDRWKQQTSSSDDAVANNATAISVLVRLLARQAASEFVAGSGAVPEADKRNDGGSDERHGKR